MLRNRPFMRSVLAATMATVHLWRMRVEIPKTQACRNSCASRKPHVHVQPKLHDLSQCCWLDLSSPCGRLVSVVSRNRNLLNQPNMRSSVCVQSPATAALPMFRLGPKPCAKRRLAVFATPDVDVEEAMPTEPVAAPDTCKHCGAALSDVPLGCDQEGHRAGGMGAFFEWWPIKAWGPCPKASAAGLPYTRKGQPTDEMLFGSQDK